MEPLKEATKLGVVSGLLFAIIFWILVWRADPPADKWEVVFMVGGVTVLLSIWFYIRLAFASRKIRK